MHKSGYVSRIQDVQLLRNFPNFFNKCHTLIRIYPYSHTSTNIHNKMFVCIQEKNGRVFCLLPTFRTRWKMLASNLLNNFKTLHLRYYNSYLILIHIWACQPVFGASLWGNLKKKPCQPCYFKIFKVV